MSGKYTLFHADGAGSTFPLVLLRIFDCPHEVVELDYKSVTERQDTPQLKRLLEANPLAQFPTMITPEGGIMTETVAIALCTYLNDRHGIGSPWSTSNLAPEQLGSFYRWMVYCPSNVYPTITIIEFPGRYVKVPTDGSVDQSEAEKWVADETSERRKDAWLLLEKQHGVKGFNGSFVLGTSSPTVLDIYITLLAHWSPYPRYQWFEKNCPKLYQICIDTMKACPAVVRNIFDENGVDAFLGKDQHAKKLDVIP